MFLDGEPTTDQQTHELRENAQLAFQAVRERNNRRGQYTLSLILSFFSNIF